MHLLVNRKVNVFAGINTTVSYLRSKTVASKLSDNMGGSKSRLYNVRVVVVGGGYGGVTVALALKGKCKLTMIDPKDHFFHNIGALRACVEPGFTENIFIPYGPSLGDAFLQSKAKRIDLKAKKVILDGGKTLDYDYLVLATGSTGPFPGKLNNVAPVTEIGLATEMYKLTLEKIKSAEKIVIMGGGAVGVELAGEIATEFPGKTLTLIHSQKNGLIKGQAFSNKFRKNIADQLKKLNVNVLLDERVVNMEDLPKDGIGKCKVKTDRGKQIDADLVFNCTGLQTNSDAYTDQLDDKMDDNDCLRVNNFLQVEGLTDVYAIGDCCNADDMKMAYTASLHANLVVKNIQLAAAGRNYKSYKSGGPNMIVAIGRHGGVVQTGTRIMGSIMAKQYKSNDLLVRKIWHQMKQVSPSKQRAMEAKQHTRVKTAPTSGKQSEQIHIKQEKPKKQMVKEAEQHNREKSSPHSGKQTEQAQTKQRQSRKQMTKEAEPSGQVKLAPNSGKQSTQRKQVPQESAKRCKQK